MDYTQLWCPTRIFLGIKALNKIVTYFENNYVKKILIVSGKLSAQANGYIDKVCDFLKKTDLNIEFFDGVEPEPSSHIVDRLTGIITYNNIDCIIALGGGSIIDVSKFAAMLATNGGNCVDYEAGRVINNRSINLIAIPTTSGSGSEVTPYSVIKNSITGRKFTITHNNFYPDLAIIAPEFTLSLPEHITLASGLDAWIHCLEAYLSRNSINIINVLAEYGMKLVFQNLQNVLVKPLDISGREKMMEAALIGGLAISHVRTGMIHTMSVALSKYIDNMPHGLINAIVLPYVLNFNRDSYHMSLSHVAGLLIDDEINDDSHALYVIKDWLSRLNIPSGLKKTGLNKSIIPDLVKRVQEDKGLNMVNIKEFTESDLADIFEAIIQDGG